MWMSKLVLQSKDIKCVILDAMGVIYQAGDDVEELLIPFLRSKACKLSDEKINEFYISCSLGNLSSIEFWKAMEIEEDILSLEEGYLKLHRLSNGLFEFLSEIKKRNIPIVCLTNDVKEWSLSLRNIFRLEKFIDDWFVSGEIGSRKPDNKIYTFLVKKMDVKPEECLFIDDRIKNINAAKELGFNTIHYIGEKYMDSQNEIFEKDKVISDLKEIIKCIQM